MILGQVDFNDFLMEEGILYLGTPYFPQRVASKVLRNDFALEEYSLSDEDQVCAESCF